MSDQTSGGDRDGGTPAGRTAQPSRAPAPAPPPTPALDDIDRRLVAELRRDARISIRSLAERVHISRTNAYARLERLLATGVVTGFTAVVSPERTGLGTSAFVALGIEQNAWRDAADRLATIPYVEHVSLVGGDFDVLVLVRAPDNAVLREVVLEQIQGVPGVRSTRTWLIFEEFGQPGA